MKRDLGAGIIMALTGLLIITVLIPYGVVEPKKIKYAALSPSYYPRIVAVALLLLGIAVSLRALFQHTPASDAEQSLRPDRTWRYVAVLLLLAIYAVTVSWLGFIVSSALVLLFAFWFAGERRLHISVPIALLLPLGLHFFFLKVANVPIPLGVLQPWLAGV